MSEHFDELRKFVVEETEIHSSQQARLMAEMDRLKRLKEINAELLDALIESHALNVNWVSVAEIAMLEHLSEYKRVIQQVEAAIANAQPQGRDDDSKSAQRTRSPSRVSGRYFKSTHPTRLGGTVLVSGDLC